MLVILRTVTIAYWIYSIVVVSSPSSGSHEDFSRCDTTFALEIKDQPVKVTIDRLKSVTKQLLNLVTF